MDFLNTFRGFIPDNEDLPVISTDGKRMYIENAHFERIYVSPLDVFVHNNVFYSITYDGDWSPFTTFHRQERTAEILSEIKDMPLDKIAEYIYDKYEKSEGR